MIGSSKLFVVLAVCLLSIVYFNDAIPTTRPTIDTKGLYKCFSGSPGSYSIYGVPDTGYISECQKCCRDKNYIAAILEFGDCYCDGYMPKF